MKLKVARGSSHDFVMGVEVCNGDVILSPRNVEDFIAYLMYERNDILAAAIRQAYTVNRELSV